MARLITMGTITIIALACMAPSAAINVTYQLAHSHDCQTWALISASVLSVLIAGLSPLVTRAAFANRQWGLALVCVLAFFVCAASNLISAIGVSSTSRSEHINATESAKETKASLQKQIDEKLSALAPLKAVTGGFTADMIRSEQEVMRIDRLWELSGECKSADGPKERAFCTSYEAKGKAIDAAEKADKLDKGIDALRARSMDLPAVSYQPSDPQSANISAFISAIGFATTEKSVGIWLNLQFAIVVEVIGAFGPLVLFGALGSMNFEKTTHDRNGGGPRPGVKHGPLTENSDTEAMSAESGQETQRRTPDDDGNGPKPRARRRTRRANKTHSAPTRHLLKYKDNSNVVPFLPHTGAELGAERIKRVAELHDMGLSNCAIGRQLGVSERTVRRDLIEAVKHSSAGMVFAAE